MDSGNRGLGPHVLLNTQTQSETRPSFSGPKVETETSRTYIEKGRDPERYLFRDRHRVTREPEVGQGGKGPGTSRVLTVKTVGLRTSPEVGTRTRSTSHHVSLHLLFSTDLSLGRGCSQSVFLSTPTVTVLVYRFDI